MTICATAPCSVPDVGDSSVLARSSQLAQYRPGNLDPNTRARTVDCRKGSSTTFPEEVCDILNSGDTESRNPCPRNSEGLLVWFGSGLCCLRSRCFPDAEILHKFCLQSSRAFAASCKRACVPEIGLTSDIFSGPCCRVRPWPMRSLSSLESTTVPWSVWRVPHVNSLFFLNHFFLCVADVATRVASLLRGFNMLKMVGVAGYRV